jgi:hemoglobin
MNSDFPTFYEVVGGEEGVRKLVDAFYDRMDTLEEVAEIRAMHPKDLRVSRQKLFEFLSGWLGGPPIYIQRRGHPRLRRRHFPFPIDSSASEQWMLCMRGALDEMGLPQDLRDKLVAAFTDVARHMENRSA